MTKSPFPSFFAGYRVWWALLGLYLHALWHSPGMKLTLPLYKLPLSISHSQYLGRQTYQKATALSDSRAQKRKYRASLMPATLASEVLNWDSYT